MKVFFGSTMIPNRFQKLVMLLQMNFHRSSKTAISKSMNFKDETNRENDHEKTSRRLEEGEMSRGGNWMEMEPPKSKSNMTRRKANSNFNSNSDLAGSTALRASTSPTASPSSRDRNRRRNLKSKRRIKSSPSFFSRFISPIAILVVTSFLVIMVFLFYTRENDKKPTLKNPYHDNNDKLVATLDFDIVFEMPFQTQTPGAPSCETSLFPEEIDFTFVTQLSHNRLWMLNQHCQRWGANNPMSVAIYTNHTLTYDDLLSEILQSAPHCDLEYMLVQRITNDGVPKANYPINALRNLAISAVQTSHFVYADIDFFGAPNLYQILNLSTTKQTFSQDSKLAAVIPALAYKRACADENDCLEENLELMPQSPVDVYEKLKSVDVWPFDPYNQGGHGSTRLWDWCRQQDGTFVDIECFKSNRYEPYVAVRYCKHLPPFQEHFSGYGKNKLTVSI